MLVLVTEHIGEDNLDYFTPAILIIDSDSSFGPTEISHLENAFYNQAKEADRVTLANGYVPSPGNMTEEKRAELDEFMRMAKILISSLGYRAFEPADDAKSSAHNASEPTQPGEELKRPGFSSASFTTAY